MSASEVVCLMLATSSIIAVAQPQFTPPVASAAEVSGIDFSSSRTFTNLQARYSACDRTDTCDGKNLNPPYQCSTDKNQNSVILKLKNDVIFFDAKMAIDADGSQLSKARGSTNLPQTSWHYPTPPRDSVDAEHVPYIVLPSEFVDKQHSALRAGMSVHIGDIAAVVFNGKTTYALVADVGPPCRIGEGSMKLHDELGNPSCAIFGPGGVCNRASNNGIEKDVLYFVFPNSAQLISKGLAPENVNKRLSLEGPKLMQALKDSSAIIESPK